MKERKYKAVVMGASAGALDALSAILSALPRDYPLPIMIVVHLPPDKKSAMAELIGARCALMVSEAEDKDIVRPGSVYFAPPDYHLLIEPDQRLSLSSDEPVLFSRPSIDVLFETAADAYGPSLIGVVLTGANNDGARGLKMIIDAGGEGLVQKPDLAHARAMPQAALDLCPSAQSLSLDEISAYLKNAGALA